MATVETRNVTKVFKKGELGAVNDVDLVTHEGEFLVFLGPSGSGKTTLLRMIAGLETPTAGDILIGGEIVTHLTPRERRIAMVFQSYALYPHLSVYDNIVFPLKAQGVPRAKHRDKVNWAAGLLGIKALLARKPRELSGGERQRVALARAIVREPAVFLLDEPLSNLDAKLRASAREELEQFHRRVPTTTIYVTHDQVEAMAMGDRVVVLHQGRVRQIGSPTEVYDDPADTFVATFLGSPPMNLLETERAVVGFRPEHLLPTAQLQDSSSPALKLELRVLNVEYLGADWIVYGVPDAGRFAGKPMRARLLDASSLRIDDVCEFAVAAERLRFFDRESEKRIPAQALELQ